MNKEFFLKNLEENKYLVENRFKDYFDKNYSLAEPLFYALDAGKIIRANLYFETLKMLGKEITSLDIDYALALEMIHAYSLVHDDLPAMDDDDTRRGKPSLHIKFGEDKAILVGDALLNEAASIILSLSTSNTLYAKAGKYLFDHTGYKGMIEGQVLDLRRPKTYDKDYLLNVYDKKTSDLFKASIISAAIVSNASNEELEFLESYAYNLGLAYQIQDDLLEDTYIDELNILNIIKEAGAIDLLDDINEEAKKSIYKFNDNDFLLFLVDYLSVRKK